MPPQIQAGVHVVICRRGDRVEVSSQLSESRSRHRAPHRRSERPDAHVNVNGDGRSGSGLGDVGRAWRLTEVPDVRARAVLRLPHGGEVWAVHEGRVLVPYVVEKVDLVLARKERRADAVDGCVAPALLEPRG